MSPARSKRQPVPHRRTRDEIVKAVAVATGIVLTTSVLIWLLRPGPAATPGTGGLMNRQPRAGWLVGTVLGVSAFAAWWILRGSRRAPRRPKVLLPVTFAVALVAAIGGGIAWPGGLLRHDIAPPPAPKSTTTTTVKGGTTTKPSVSTSSLPVVGPTGGTGGTAIGGVATSTSGAATSTSVPSASTTASP